MQLTAGWCIDAVDAVGAVGVVSVAGVGGAAGCSSGQFVAVSAVH